MEKKNSANDKVLKKSVMDERKTINSSKANQNKDKDLPWWVEILFVQIGLPDKLLIKFLKIKRKSKDFYKNEKKFIFTILFILSALIYVQPIINYSKEKLKCQKDAISYLTGSQILNKRYKSKLRMLSINFCNGGNEYKNFKADNI